MAQLKDTNVKSSLKINGNDILSLVYPVGSIYLSVKNTNPSSLFGGTWVAWGEGRVPIGVGSNGTTNYSSVEATGGAESRSHSHAAKTSGAASGNTGNTALSIAQMPAHNHAIYNYNGAGSEMYSESANVYGTSSDAISPFKTFWVQMNMANTGGGQAHTHTLNNHTHSIPASDSKSTDVRQPYITCYMWKRTA